MSNQTPGDGEAASSKRPGRARRPLSATDASGLLDAIDSMGWGVLIADPEGLVVYANAAFLKLFDYDSVGAVAGCPAADLFVVRRVGEVALLQSPVEKGGQSTMEFQVCKRGGQILEVEATSLQIRDADGAPVGVMVSYAGGDLVVRAPGGVT